jgi:co-chaperonin GroES (HSP10)
MHTSLENKLNLKPLNDCVLVELQQAYKQFNAKESKYDTRTEGIVIAVPRVHDNTIGYLVNRRVHFEEFKEGARIKRNGKIYSFIKIDDIRGYEVE